MVVMMQISETKEEKKSSKKDVRENKSESVEDHIKLARLGFYE